MTTATHGSAASPPRRPRFRYAPTPSRWLHVGNGLAALVGWGLARAAHGAFVLRIEDIDRARCRPEFEDATLRDLAWLGVDWDEGPDVGGPHGPYRQSARMGRYDALLAGLRAADRAYPCRCSRADVRAAASAPHLGPSGEADEVPYPGTCRPGPERGPVAVADDRGGVRLWVDRLGDDAVVTWRDGLLGDQREDVRATCGDFLLGRPGQPSYQLAVVADDREMGITDVVRGRDLLGSTARQVLLHRVLAGSRDAGQGAARDGDALVPRFHHHPLILDELGRKLSKRDDAIALRTFRESGADPAALIATLGRAVGLFPGTVRRARAADFTDALGAPPDLHDGRRSDLRPEPDPTRW